MRGHLRGGTETVGFVDNENIRHFHRPGLHRLNPIAHLRAGHHHEGVHVVADIGLGLADAGGLHEDHVEAGRIYQIERAASNRLRDAASGAAG